MMRPLLITAVLLLWLPAASANTNSWNFRVLLDGREIGHHRFTLRSVGEERELRSEARFNVRFLFINAYRYAHEATERWRDDCLRSLVSRTETNGKREAVNTAWRDERLVVEGGGRRDELEGCVMSFAYWNLQILNSRRLLNSQTGELLPVTVAPQGEETIEVRGQPLTAQRHRLSTPQLTIDLWYAGGEWVALESPVKGGRRLRYQLM